MEQRTIHRQFTAALDGLVEQISKDASILAAILCGSLSHDTVWAKSDIDLVLVTIDDRKVDKCDVALYADGVNVHAWLVQRAQFRKLVEGSLHQSFTHALLAKGRLLYTHDETIADLCRQLREIGTRDTGLQLLRAATAALPAIDKAHKWLVTRGDLDYAALWILYAATPLAQMELIDARVLADREVLPQAAALNPAFFRIVYTDLLNAPKTTAGVQAALDAVDAYVAERATRVFGPVIDYLREAAEPRTCTEIDDHFKRHYDLGGVTTACEYLADRRIIGKAAVSVRLTRRSHVDVQELAFFYTGEPE
jgi:predicted nucleotidyltransferase